MAIRGEFATAPEGEAGGCLKGCFAAFAAAIVGAVIALTPASALAVDEVSSLKSVKAFAIGPVSIMTPRDAIVMRLPHVRGCNSFPQNGRLRVDGWLKVLVAAACVVVIAGGGYYGWGEYQRSIEAAEAKRIAEFRKHRSMCSLMMRELT